MVKYFKSVIYLEYWGAIHQKNRRILLDLNPEENFIDCALLFHNREKNEMLRHGILAEALWASAIHKNARETVR